MKGFSFPGRSEESEEGGQQDPENQNEDIEEMEQFPDPVIQEPPGNSSDFISISCDKKSFGQYIDTSRKNGKLFLKLGSVPDKKFEAVVMMDDDILGVVHMMPGQDIYPMLVPSLFRRSTSEHNITINLRSGQTGSYSFNVSYQ